MQCRSSNNFALSSIFHPTELGQSVEEVWISPAQILQDELGGLSLTSSRFTRDHETLVELIVLQVPEGCLSQGEHMGLQSSDLLSVIFEDICLQEKSINIVAWSGSGPMIILRMSD